jgi:hypothetical protein
MDEQADVGSVPPLTNSSGFPSTYRSSVDFLLSGEHTPPQARTVATPPQARTVATPPRARTVATIRMSA